MAIDVRAILDDGEVFQRVGTDIFGLDLPLMVGRFDVTTTPGSVYVDLTEGKSGGDELVGGSGSGDNLTLSSTSHATKGRVLFEDEVTLLSGGKTYTSGPNYQMLVTDAATVNFTTGNFGSIILANLTVTFNQTTASIPGVMMNHNATYKNAAASGIIALGQFPTVLIQPTIQGDTSAITQATQTDILSRTKFSRANSGSLTVTNWVQFEAGSQATSVDTGTTITNRTAFVVRDPQGSGTLVNNTGLFIAAMTKGTTTNIGISNGSQLRQIAPATFGADATATYGIHMQATTGDAGSIHLAEVTTTPTNPSSGAGVVMYHKANLFVLAYNDAGTMRYKYLDMTGTGVTWVHTTSAP